MAKGISPIIATLLLLMITVALSLTVYVFTFRLLDKSDIIGYRLCMDLCKIANMEFHYYDSWGCICLEEICSDYFEYNNTLYGIDCKKVKMKIKEYGE